MNAVNSLNPIPGKKFRSDYQGFPARKWFGFHDIFDGFNPQSAAADFDKIPPQVIHVPAFIVIGTAWRATARILSINSIEGIRAE